MTRRIIAAGGIGAALALGLAAPAAMGQASNDPAFSNTVLSVEGPTSNVLAPSWVAVRTSGLRTVRDGAGARVRISARSALSQAITGTRANSVGLAWTWYAGFGAPYVSRIGGVGPRGAKGWNFRVNSLYWSKGSNNVNLGTGDRVTWYWGAEKDTVLEIATPSTGIAPGAAVQPGTLSVQVNEVTWKRVRTPSAGATVTYGTATAVTDSGGLATFTAAPGVNVLRATKASRIAATRQVCTIGAPQCPAS